MTNARHAAVLARVDPGPGYGKVYPCTTDTELLPNQDGGLVTNDGAPGGILATLPEAVPGYEYPFQPSGLHSFALKPAGINSIRGLASGKRLGIPANELTVVACKSAGIWDIVIGQKVTTRSRIELEEFVSAYAHPGERVVFSGADWAANPPSQTQRRKNWRIFMEACLLANGGTGEYDGDGWHTTNEPAHRARRGEVFISGPLVIEPYADSEYAPFFATADTTQLGATTRGWSLPGGIVISGNGGTIGYNTTTGLVGHTASRLIGYNAPAAQWYGGATPLGSGVGRHLSYWKLKNIGLARIGDTGVASVANPVLRAANFYDTGLSAITSVVSYWQMDDVTIDLDPSSGYAQVGFLNQCGLDCQVPSLRIMGNGNPGWCLVQTGTFNGTAKVQPTTTVMYGDLQCFGSKRGVLFSYCDAFIELLDLEPVGLSASKQQLIIGDACEDVKIGMFWAEDCYQPDGATASGADAAIGVIGGIDSEWNPNYGVGTYTKPGCVEMPHNYLSGHSGSAPTYGIMAKSAADLQIGPITAATFGTAVLRLQPGTVSVPDDPAYLRGSFDSAKAQWGGVAAFLSDGTDYAYNGFVAMSGMVDRALGGNGRAPAKPNRSSSFNSVAVRGEKVMHTAPVAGGPQGWICTTAGAYPTCVYTPFGASYLEGTATFNPANLVAGAAPDSTNVTVTGAALGDKVTASFSLDLQKVRMDAYVSAADTVTVTFQNVNTGGADVNLGSGTISCRVFKS